MVDYRDPLLHCTSVFGTKPTCRCSRRLSAVGRILLQKSKIDQPRAKVDFWGSCPSAASLFSAATKVRGRFWMNRYGPSRRRAKSASAALEIFAPHPKKTFATVSGAKRTWRRGAVTSPFDPERMPQLDYRPRAEGGLIRSFSRLEEGRSAQPLFGIFWPSVGSRIERRRNGRAARNPGIDIKIQQGACDVLFDTKPPINRRDDNAVYDEDNLARCVAIPAGRKRLLVIAPDRGFRTLLP